MNYKMGNAIEVTYQSTGQVTGLADVTMTIYDETHSLDAVNFPDVVMTEIGATGRYYGSFTPDVVGTWTVTVNSVTKPGPVVKQFQVGTADVDSVAGDISALNDLSSAQVTTVLTSYGVATVSDVSGGAMLG